jgi:hypothetical protein
MLPFAFSALLVLLLFTITAILVIYIFKNFPDSSATVNLTEGTGSVPATPALAGLLEILQRLVFNVKGVIAGIVIMLLIESLLLYLFYDKNVNVYSEFLVSQSGLVAENSSYKKQAVDLQSQLVQLRGKMPWKIRFIIPKCFNRRGLEFNESEYNQLFTPAGMAVSPNNYQPEAGQRMVIAEINEERLKDVDWTCSLITREFGTRIFYKTDSCVRLNEANKTITIGPVQLNCVE